jgi:hypothetical protein
MDDEPTRRAPVRPMDDAPSVRLSERLLVEWVASAKVGDAFPEPWSNAQNPRESILRTLVQLGVIERPAPDTSLASIATEASVAARAWLERHPA